MITTRDILKGNLAPINDKAALEALYMELIKQYPPEPWDDIDVYINTNGDLHRGYIDKYIWDWKTKQRQPNVLYQPPLKNNTFVDILEYQHIVSYGSRKGCVLFERFYGGKTYMSIAQWENMCSSLIKGLLVGNFAHRNYYGHQEIYCIEVLL